MSSSNPQAIADGHVVAIYYSLENAAGEQLDSNKNGGEPLVYLHGAGNIVPGLEKQLIGTKRGETVKLVVPAADGYGEPQAELFEEVPRTGFPPEIDLQPGMFLQGKSPDGVPVRIRVHEVGEETVTVDKNHPLAGQELHFEVYVYGIREATEEETAHGHAHGKGGHQH